MGERYRSVLLGGECIWKVDSIIGGVDGHLISATLLYSDTTPWLVNQRVTLMATAFLGMERIEEGDAPSSRTLP